MNGPMTRLQPFIGLLAVVFAIVSCAPRTTHIGGESAVPTSVVPDLVSETPAPTHSTAAPLGTTTLAQTAAPVTPMPTTKVLAVVDILSSGWQQHPLGISALGGPDLTASNSSHQVIGLALPSGCCFTSPAIIAGPVGGPFSNPEDLLPNKQPGQQTLLGSGPADLHAGPNGFLAVGAWVYADSATDEKQVVPHAWTSDDGTGWQPHRIPGSGTVTSVVRVDGHYLAILSSANEPSTPDSSGTDFPANALLTSEDGITWGVSRELDQANGIQTIHEIGEQLVIATVGVELVSADHGITWGPPTGRLAAGELLVGEGGALLLYPDETLWSSDGITWTQVGYGGRAPAAGYAGNWPGRSRTVFSHGEVVIVVSGSDFWVSGPSSPWVLVPRPAAFADLNGGPPWINNLTIATNGPIIAIGATHSAQSAEKPIQDYVTWTHPGLPPLPNS